MFCKAAATAFGKQNQMDGIEFFTLKRSQKESHTEKGILT